MTRGDSILSVVSEGQNFSISTFNDTDTRKTPLVIFVVNNSPVYMLHNP